MRIEKDSLGEKPIPNDVLWGIHTARALENFNAAGRAVRPELARAMGAVKLAAARVNRRLGYLDSERFSFLEQACLELWQGKLDNSIVVDALQGGAGTSTNLNVCEVIANRASRLSGRERFIDALAHANLHQSTNDTFPTAIKVAALLRLKVLETSVAELQDVLQRKEKEFEQIVKPGRTELMDAVPTTLGREFGAWAEAIARDRWRIFKSTERLRVVNFGGTAVGSGMGAPREYIFQVTDELREITGLPLCRAENLIDGTQNADVFAEVSGMLKCHAMNLMKISGDLRLLASGPDTGLGEITLPALQVGSSIMPGKVNPVIPEMVAQVAIQAMACDQAISLAVGLGQLELNAFLPLIAENLLTMTLFLESANEALTHRCVGGIAANRERCKELVYSSKGIITVLVPHIGYAKASAVAAAITDGMELLEAVEKVGGVSRARFEELAAPSAVNALGFRGEPGRSDA